MSGLTSKQMKGSNCNEILPNIDGSINIVAIWPALPQGAARAVVSIFNEIIDIAKDSNEEIVQYTVPVGKIFLLTHIPVSGQNIGEYKLMIGEAIADKQRTYFGGDLNAMFDFRDELIGGLLLQAGGVITVYIKHYRPDVADFNARIQGVLIG